MGRWQWMEDGNGAEVIRKCSPTAKARKKGDLFINAELFARKIWFRTVSEDLTHTHTPFCNLIMRSYNNICLQLYYDMCSYTHYIKIPIYQQDSMEGTTCSFSGLADLPSGQGSGQGSIEGCHRETRDCKAFTKTWKNERSASMSKSLCVVVKNIFI